MSEERKSIKAGKLVNKNPDKRLLLTIKEQSVKTEHIADNAITSSKVSLDAVEYITEDVQNQIDSIQIGGWAISNQLGNDPHIGISQKALTELIGYDHVPDSIRGRIQKVEDEIGSDTTSDSLSGRITSLEGAVGDGGSVDERIATAKNQVIGLASSGYNTLGKIESRISEEATARENTISAETARAQAAENTLDTKIDSSVITINNKINENVATEKNRAMAAEELLRQAYIALTHSDIIVGTLPANGEENIIYRVPGETSYADYMWNGSSFVKMAEYDNAIDNDIDADSDNLISNKAIGKYIEKINTGMTLFGLTDYEGSPYLYIDDKNNLNIPININAEYINGLSLPYIDNYPSIKIALVDEQYNIIWGINNNNEQIGLLNNTEEDQESSTEESAQSKDIYIRNADKDAYLLNDSLYGTGSSSKRGQLLIVTDTHDNITSFQNAIDAGAAFKSLNGIIHLGDSDTYIPNSLYDFVEEIIYSSKIPFFFVVGNHEVGTHEAAVHLCKDRETLYTQYIKPSVSKGWLSNGEYPEITGYDYPLFYYHDFKNLATNIRLIVLDCYDSKEEFDTTYWTPIVYNESYSTIKNGSYLVGTKVNAPNYTKYSFEAVQDVVVPSIADKYYDVAYDFYPKYKEQRYPIWYSQEQLEWFCGVLENTPENYNVIIAQHETILCGGNAHVDANTRFHNYLKGDSGFPSSSPMLKYREDEYENLTEVSQNVPLSRFAHYAHDIIPYTSDERIDSLEDCAIISRIVNAWQTGENISLSFNAAPHYYLRRTHKQYDDCEGDTIRITTTFTGRENKNVLFISGHNHSDGIIVSDVYQQKEIKFLSGVVENTITKDIIRNSSDVRAMDALTALTFYCTFNTDNDIVGANIHLTRIGADITNRINTETGELIKKSNEIIKL